MRPEMREYNYDWMMGGVMHAASRLPNGTPKEVELAYKYMPYYKNVAGSFIDAGDVGIASLKMFDQYFENILTAHERGKKICATSFTLSPTILTAMDVVPICAEMLTAMGGMVWHRGMFDYLDYACEVGLPETSCSSQRGSLGAYFAGMGESIDFFMANTPGICDTNANAFSFAASYMDKPFFQMGYPKTMGDERTEAWELADYKLMVQFIEEQTGNKLDYDRLAEVLAEVEKQDVLIADIEDMQSLRPTPIPPLFVLSMCCGKFLFPGQKMFTELLETMMSTAKELAETGKSGLATGEERLRACLFYIDHYTLDMNFWNWLSENGVAHLGSILSHHFSDNIDYLKALKSSSYSIDTATPESMLNTFSQINARMPMVRSIRGPYDQPGMWLEETLVIAEHFGAECMIYNGTPGCRNTWANVKMMARDLEKHGYPTHIMFDDAFDDRMESWDATRTRLEEFFTIRGLL